MTRPLTARWPLEGLDYVRGALLAAYGDPTRGYHDLLHLAEVLDALDELSAHEEFERLPVVLAAWFHDGVYDGRPSDEEESAAWALRALAGRGFPPEVAPEVARLVRLTASHHPDAGDVNGAALCDADLAILGTDSPERYGEYVAGVRREYAHVPDRDFALGRGQVLRALLETPDLYATPYGRERWQARAYANVAAELRALDETVARG